MSNVSAERFLDIYEIPCWNALDQRRIVADAKTAPATVDVKRGKLRMQAETRKLCYFIMI